MSNEPTDGTQKKSPLSEIIQPFIDLAKAPRALWALNLVYLIEGFAYFGTLYYLAMFFNNYVKLGDMHAGWMVGLMTSGITFSMLFFGSRVDAWGLRRTLFTALGLMLLGRIVLSLSPSLGLGTASLLSNIDPDSLLVILSPLNLAAAAGIVLIVVGFGMYQPAIYAGTRAVTTAATSGMAFAMLYAVNNLGGWLPTFMSPIRNTYGIQGALIFYAIITVLGITCLAVLLTRKTLEKTLAEKVETETALPPHDEKPANNVTEESKESQGRLLGFARFTHWLKHHPLADPKFSFFIFCLIPTQTLFAYSWFIMPQYVARAYAGGWLGDNFETATSLNSLLIFILCPIVAAISVRAKVYNMMIFGTAVMASSAFLLSVGPTITGLFGYILVLSIGEAMWQPRFLQYAAEIAPAGRTGAYMGVAQFPWFLTKMIVPLYSGIALSKWCPIDGPKSTGTMWLTFGFVAIVTPLLLISARGWVGKDFKTKSA
ncbi:MAG: MFS transporter [Holophagaceae bacterium]|nr:MFS transporter [Holophagaceae bacterium]